MPVPMRKRFCIPLAILGGVALWASQEPVAIWPLAFIAIAVLWAIIRASSLWRAGGLAYIWAFTYFFFLFDWATQATGIILAQIALAGVEAVYIGILGIVWAGIRRIPEVVPRLRKSQRTRLIRVLSSPVVQVLLGAASWAAMEILRSAWPLGGMPWGALGFAMIDSPLVALAPIGSTQLVGFAVVVVGILLGTAAEKFRNHAGQAVILTAIALLVAVAPAVLSIGAKPVGHQRIGIVQGNVPNLVTLGHGESRALIVTHNHAEATRLILDQNPDLILWPESASDRDIRKDPQAQQIVTDIAREAGVPILLGTQEYVGDVRYNDYVVMMPDGSITDTYSKQHPVPFGEYVPGRDLLRPIAPVVDEVRTDMAAGSEPALLSVDLDGESLQFATPICFEVAYDLIVADAVRQGANIIVVPTNNATFGDTGEPHQQFAMTRFRAVEHGRTAIQVATSGISGVATANGVMGYETEIFVQDAQVVSVPYYEELTLATTTAVARHVLTYALGILAGMVSVFGWVNDHRLTRRKRRKG